MQQPTTQPGPRLSLELAALLIVGLLWGAQFGLNKIQLETIPPFTGVAMRLSIAAIFLWMIVFARGYPRPSDLPTWRLFLIQGLLTSGGPGVMVMWSQQFIDSALAAILNSTTPIFATLLTVLITRHERVGVQKVAGLAVGLGGVVLVVGIEALQGLDRGFIGQVVVMLSALGYGGAAVFGRRFAAISPVTAAAGATTCSALLLTFVALAFERPFSIVPSLRSLAALATSAIFCGGIAVILYYRLIKTLGSIGVSSLGYLKAAFGVLVGCFILSEPLTLSILISLTGVALGVALINEQFGSRARPSSSPRLETRA